MLPDQLKQDIKAVLANAICSVQSLDVAVDRNRVLKELMKMLATSYAIYKKCIGCSALLDPVEARNALSRYGHGYICNDCGTKEAIQGDFIKLQHGS